MSRKVVLEQTAAQKGTARSSEQLEGHKSLHMTIHTTYDDSISGILNADASG